MQNERTDDCLEIVIAEPKVISVSSDIEWDIRNLGSNDLSAVCKICRESFPLEYSESWFEEVCSGRYISFGLFHFGTLTGLLVAELKFLGSCDIEDQGIGRTNSDVVVYLMSLAVTSKYRRKGIATLLLNHLKTTVLEKPPFPKIVFLHVLSTNHGAISFYKDNSFIHHSTLINYYMINGVYYEGLTFVHYANGKRPPCSCKGILQCIRCTFNVSVPLLVKTENVLILFPHKTGINSYERFRYSIQLLYIRLQYA
ncbi:N-alpha-acetyltransferase 60 [Aphelenchoides bicaudatus]|nr:N-alpha-acetyltransferase 60 [Aphelenchoides bicaudatus]